MKNSSDKQIPNIAVYLALYVAIFGISIWLLIWHQDSPNNWFLYFAMLASVLAGLVKLVIHSRRRQQST